MHFVSRKYLFLLIALLWSAVGLLLIWRAVGWISSEPVGRQFQVLLIAGACGVVAYQFGFRRILEKNIARIRALDERTPIWEFTSLKGYAMIVGMIGLGIVLRNSDLPKLHLSVPYAAMGLTLLAGSGAMVRQFLRVESEQSMQ